MTYANRRVIINSLMRAQDEIIRARKYALADGGQTSQEMAVDMTGLVTAINEIINTVREIEAA